MIVVIVLRATPLIHRARWLLINLPSAQSFCQSETFSNKHIIKSRDDTIDALCNRPQCEWRSYRLRLRHRYVLAEPCLTLLNLSGSTDEFVLTIGSALAIFATVEGSAAF